MRVRDCMYGGCLLALAKMIPAPNALRRGVPSNGTTECHGTALELFAFSEAGREGCNAATGCGMVSWLFFFLAGHG
jgi:hypothetical protein